jgi:hypothetical protein
MPERRAHPRRRIRLIVNFGGPGARTAGITFDVSRSGLFVRTVHLPRVGSALDLVVHLTDGGQITLTGRVVRTFSAVGTIRFVVPSGFGVRVSPRSELYESFVASLFGGPPFSLGPSAPLSPDPVQLLFWICGPCGHANFKLLPLPVPFGKEVPAICRACEAVARETLLPGNVVTGRRRSPRTPGSDDSRQPR